MNFGTLKDIFVESLIESYTSEDNKGKILYKKFLKTLKESETLKTAFIVFKNIENKTITNEIKAIEYLKESISLFDTFRGEKSLIKECEKLESILEYSGVEYKNKEGLFESIYVYKDDSLRCLHSKIAKEKYLLNLLSKKMAI